MNPAAATTCLRGRARGLWQTPPGRARAGGTARTLPGALGALGALALAGALLAGCGDRSAESTPAQDGRGEALFATYCAACHRADGAGDPGRIPPLAASPWVRGPQDRVIRVVLHGLRGPIEVNGTVYQVEMLGFGPILPDEDVASVLTYVRRRFGQVATPVTAASVARVRAATAGRTEYWTVDELLELP